MIESLGSSGVVRIAEGGEADGNGDKRGAGDINVAREVESIEGGDLTKTVKLRNIPLLALSVTKVATSFLVGTIMKAEGILEAEAEDADKTCRTQLKIHTLFAS